MSMHSFCHMYWFYWWQKYISYTAKLHFKGQYTPYVKKTSKTNLITINLCRENP